MATLGQFCDALSALANKIPGSNGWEEIPVATMQQALADRNRLAAEFIRFMANGGRMYLGDLKVTTAPFDPVKFIGGEGWKVISDEHDKRNDGITEVDLNKVDFVTCLKEGETFITGEEKLERLKALKQTRFGGELFMGLWIDYQARKENSVLETLFRTKKITYLDFFGDVLLDRDNRRVLYLYRDVDGQWYWHFDWLGHVWNDDNVSAVSQVPPTNA